MLIPDLPGFGQSPKPFVDYTMDFFAETLLGFLDEKQPSGRLQVIGHSLGALLALELAARLPGRVERLALLNTPRFADAESAHRVMFDGSASYRRLLTINSVAANLAQVRRTGWCRAARHLRRLPWAVLADARKFTFRSLSSTIEHCLLDYNVDAILDRFPAGAAALMIHGRHDSVALLDAIQELRIRPPYPELHVLPDAGHNPFHTHTATCLELIRGFFQESGRAVAGPRLPA